MRKVKVLGITLFRGADFNFIIEVPDVANITGYTFDGSIKASTNPDDDPLLNFTFTILNQTLFPRLCECSLAFADIDELIASIASAEDYCRLTTPYMFDIFMTNTVNFRERIIQGPALLSPNVTPAPGDGP